MTGKSLYNVFFCDCGVEKNKDFEAFHVYTNRKIIINMHFYEKESPVRCMKLFFENTTKKGKNNYYADSRLKNQNCIKYSNSLYINNKE